MDPAEHLAQEIVEVDVAQTSWSASSARWSPPRSMLLLGRAVPSLQTSSAQPLGTKVPEPGADRVSPGRPRGSMLAHTRR